MKRRNADIGKIRRPIKRNKITDGMYGSTTVLYMKFLVLWAIVITADFMFMFRFEFLWPFWLLLRSVHDSFKYKGLAFSVLFVCIAITSDLVCLFFIPVHWLLFAASTYVWVQYVWHTDKGICLPTIILWMLFVYLEAGIRWKDSRHMPHLDLCRPFAAHCIGYPVVTLGFGFKSYVGYRMRQRKQREVSKENEFYMQLLQQALPQEDNQEDVAVNSPSGVMANTAISSTTTTVTSGQNNTFTQNGSVTSAAQMHQNSIDSQHHNNNHQHNQLLTASMSSSISSSTSAMSASSATATNNDDKSYVQIAGQSAGQFQHQNSSNNNTAHHQQNSNLSNNNTSSSANKSAQTRSSVNSGNYSSSTSSTTNSTTPTSNGHVGGITSSNVKNSRRSVDKDNNNTSASSRNNTITTGASNHKDNFSSSVGKVINSNSYHLSELNGNSKDWDSGGSINYASTSLTQKDKNSNNYDTSNISCLQQQHQQNIIDSTCGGCGSAKKSTLYCGGGQLNENTTQYEVEEVVEPIEKVKGRRNRSKKDTASKDNHQIHHTNNSNNATNQSNSSQNHHHQNLNNNANSNHSHNTKDSNSDTSSISSSASMTSSPSTISNLASQVVAKICESCLRLEADVKKYRSEISHMKQIENELRQKLEANLTTKSCLQAKQKECDDLEKRIQELISLRQHDMITQQNTERRLTEEKRQKQSLEAQLSNEKKARKIAEDKASRPECSESCKQRKQQIDAELKHLRRDLKTAEESKEMAQQQGRKFEQELRMFEAEIRNRDSQPGTEMLMSALAAMQDKNCTLEKNLSAETRVKLDLFSALGEAKRQLEIKESLYRSKKDEVHDLKAKIAQLLAVMPNDSLCLPTCSNTGSSMLRMNDTPPLQGPSSPMMGLGPPTQHQQMLSAHQLNQRVSNPGVNSNQQQQQMQQQQMQQQQQQQQLQQQHQQQQQNVVVSQSSVVAGGVPSSQSGSSNLDPNASVYTPKNPMVGGNSNQNADA